MKSFLDGVNNLTMQRPIHCLTVGHNNVVVLDVLRFEK